MSDQIDPETQDTIDNIDTIDADAAVELVEEATRRGDAIRMGLRGIPALEILGRHPRKRATFGEAFLTVFPAGLVFVIEHLTHRELRVFASLASVQGYGEQSIPLRVSDIAYRTGLTPSAVSRAVARMQALGILRSGSTIDGQRVGLRISRRVMFRGNAFHFNDLDKDPPLADPEEAPIIQRMRRRPLLRSAHGALAAKRCGARSGLSKTSGGGNERGTNGSVERADDGAARTRAQGRSRRRPRPASPRPAELPDDGSG